MRSAPDQKEVGMLCKDELLLSYYFVLVLTTNIMTRIMKKELVVEFSIAIKLIKFHFQDYLQYWLLGTIQEAQHCPSSAKIVRKLRKLSADRIGLRGWCPVLNGKNCQCIVALLVVVSNHKFGNWHSKAKTSFVLGIASWFSAAVLSVKSKGTIKLVAVKHVLNGNLWTC